MHLFKKKQNKKKREHLLVYLLFYHSNLQVFVSWAEQDMWGRRLWLWENANRHFLKIENIINTLSDGESERYTCVSSVCSVDSYHLGWLSGGGSGSRRSLLWLLLQRQPVLRHLSSGTFLWHHKFLHFLWPALGGYKGHTWPVIVCLALSSVSLSSTAADFLQSQTLRLPEDTRISLDLDAGPIKALVYLMSDRCKEGFCSSVFFFSGALFTGSLLAI